MKYGEILFFHTLTMHGTKKNTSSVNRISFDFRILEKGKSPGIKSLNDMFQSYFKKKIRHKESIFLCIKEIHLWKIVVILYKERFYHFMLKKIYFIILLRRQKYMG